MGFFDRLSASATTNEKLGWKTLNELDQIDQIFEDSFQRTQVIFKHSVSCGISAGAKYRLESDWETRDDVDFYYLDLLAHRAVSNQVSEKSKVVHQSPQLIVIKDGQAIAKASHHAINLSWLQNATNSYTK